MHPRTELEQALLALVRVAREALRHERGRSRRIDVADRVLRVEEVEALEHHFETYVAAERELLADAQVELRERASATGVHVRDAGRKVEPVAVAVEVGVRPDHVRRTGVITHQAGDVDSVWSPIDGAKGDAMPCVAG